MPFFLSIIEVSDSYHNWHHEAIENIEAIIWHAAHNISERSKYGHAQNKRKLVESSHEIFGLRIGASLADSKMQLI